MSVRAFAVLVVLLGGSGCLKAWDVGGPWACDAGRCAEGFTCDDGVCCKPDGEPRCPTLPYQGTCPLGSRPATYYRDNDGDGTGDPATGRPFCRAPVQEPWVADAGDCNDGDPTVFPGATERCNGLDDNCNAVLDEGLTALTFYEDIDGDGFGDTCAGCVKTACEPPPGFVAVAGDCAPAIKDIHPGAPEYCNNIDDNCNGQKDDPPFMGVENPGVTGGRLYECDTGLPGVCRDGGVQCVFSPMSSRFEETCVQRVAESTDVCGNLLDEDCSGASDDRPGCGGPASLLTERGLSINAFRFLDAGTTVPLPSRCLKNLAGSEAMAWLNPSWVGTGNGLHVLAIEAPAGTWWDLSTARSLALTYVSTAVANVGGVWDQPGRSDNPIILLCGDTETQFQRYTPTTAGQRLQATSTPRTLRIPLRPTATDAWSAANTTFDLSKVRRIEVLVTPELGNPSITFTTRFLRDAGVVGFE